MLSKQQIKSLLTAAASDRLYKLDWVAAVERAEGITPTTAPQEPHHRLKAARSRGAAVAAEDHDAIVASRLRIEDFAEIDRTIAALDRQVRSNVPRKKALDMLADCGGSERLTGALLDRLTHHVRILTMNGDSYRLKQSAGRRRTAVETVAAEQSQATAETDDKPRSV